MKTALFIMLPVPSHYNACFGLANQLQKKGYRVIFSGTADLQRHVETQGFEFTTLCYIDEYLISNWRAALGFFLKSIINKKFMLFRYREFLQAVYAAREMCVVVNPDEIFIDQHLNHYYFLLQSDPRRITLVNTKLPTRREKGIPPLTCDRPFKDNFIYSLLAEVLWETYLAKNKAAALLKRIVFFGIDDQFFLNRIALKRGVNVERYRRPDNALYESIKNVPIVHVRPQFLEYDWYKLDVFEKFVYYPYKKQNEVSLKSTPVWEIIRAAQNDPGVKKAYLIYASLGTLSELNKAVAIPFFHKLITAVENIPNTYLIVSAGEMYQNIVHRQNEKTSIQRYVPQTELLPYCDIMITHAGMNSICECLTAGVPMLAYPLNIQSDQPGNAARLVSKGWGMKGNLRSDTEGVIRDNIVELLNNPAYRYNISHINMTPINDWYPETDLAKS
jgi:UDP:flavonoid glycosyltransferase YjiC (YdhE family)